MTWNPIRTGACLTLMAACVIPLIAGAQGGPSNQGPAKVVATEGREGVLAPQAEYRGTVYFKEVSDVASEVAGKVTAVLFEEGQRVRKGQLLVRLDDELLKKDLAARQAALDRDRAELEDAEVRFRRAESLVERGLSTTEQFDEFRLDVKSLQFQLSATQAELERTQTVIKKSTISAPFDGIVIERSTEIGEWKSDGDTVAVIARENEYSVLVDVPESSVEWIEPGQEVELQVGRRTILGNIDTIIPRGDITTRTFPVKIRIETESRLLEGMATLARLPAGEEVACIIVPRDALLHQSGEDVVFTVQDALARRHPVRVLGYEGSFVGISSPELTPGHVYIVTGHERLRNGDRVELLSAAAFPAPTSDSDD